MTFAGWGGYNGRLDARAANNRTVARWSGNTSTAGTTPNRVGGAVPSMLQATPADRPGIKTLTGGVKALEFDGTNSDLALAPSAAVALVGPRLYWAFHARFSTPAPVLKTLWAEWGTTERLQIAIDALTVIVTVALSAVTTATATFPLSLAARQAGVFLEIFFDGNAVVATNRVRLYINQSEVPASAFTGTFPTSMLVGNAVSNWLGSLNGLSNALVQVAHFWFLQGHPTTIERAALALDEAPNWTFAPGDLSTANGGPVSAWLQASAATLVSGAVSSLPDALNSNPATQTTAGSRPPLETSSNGLPCMHFFGGAGSRGLVWPLAAGNNSVNQWGIACWIRFDTFGTSFIYMVDASSGASPVKTRLMLNSVGGFEVTQFISGGNGRYGVSAAAAIVIARWSFLTVEYDKDPATEALKQVITVNGAAIGLAFNNIGAGGTLGALPAAAGNSYIASSNALVGPNIYVFNSKMAAASQGLLTPQARFDLMNYERPLDAPEMLSTANGGPLSAWLRVSQSTVTGLGVSSLPDSFNTNPAVQATDAKRPAKGTSANALAILTPDGGDALQWPLNASNNSATQLGFGIWFNPVSLTGQEVLISLDVSSSGGATANKMQFSRNGNVLHVFVWQAGVLAFLASTTNLVAGAWHFLTMECDTPSQSLVVSVGGVTTSSVLPTTTPLQAVTGNAVLLADQVNPVFIAVSSGSKVGPNIYAFNAKMPGATVGLLTAAARTALMSFEVPT
jgi:hypothetical protein